MTPCIQWTGVPNAVLHRPRDGANRAACLLRRLRGRAAMAGSEGVLLRELLGHAAADDNLGLHVLRAPACLCDAARRGCAGAPGGREVYRLPRRASSPGVVPGLGTLSRSAHTRVARAEVPAPRLPGRASGNDGTRRRGVRCRRAGADASAQDAPARLQPGRAPGPCSGASPGPSLSAASPGTYRGACHAVEAHSRRAARQRSWGVPGLTAGGRPRSPAGRRHLHDRRDSSGLRVRTVERRRIAGLCDRRSESGWLVVSDQLLVCTCSGLAFGDRSLMIRGQIGSAEDQQLTPKN